MDSMTVIFPTEILLQIFQHLEARELISCRRVCILWKSIVESLDNKWKELCERTLPKYKEKFSKSQLTWYDMYNSISLWSVIDAAEVSVTQISAETSEFQLQQDLIAVPQHSSCNDSVYSTPESAFYVRDPNLIWIDEPLSDIEDYPDEEVPDLQRIKMKERMAMTFNTLVYYDLYTLEESHRENFNFQFNDYTENEHLIVMINSKHVLCVIIKANKKIFHVGKMPFRYYVQRKTYYDPTLVSTPMQMYLLLGDEVYFVDSKGTHCISRIREEDGILSMKTTKIETSYFDGSPTFALTAKDGVIHIFTAGYHAIIRPIVNDAFAHDTSLVLTPPIDNACKMFESRGFDWAEQHIYGVLTGPFLEQFEHKSISRFTDAIVHSHGKIVVVGTTSSTLEIFDKPDMVSDFYYKPPIKSIDLKRLKTALPYAERKITKIDVVEKDNGHKIIVCYGGDIVVLDLTHGCGLKRTISTSSCDSNLFTDFVQLMS